jgi:hypothetical protein
MMKSSGLADLAVAAEDENTMDKNPISRLSRSLFRKNLNDKRIPVSFAFNKITIFSE